MKMVFNFTKIGIEEMPEKCYSVESKKFHSVPGGKFMTKPVIGVISAKHEFNTLLPQFSTSAHYLEQTALAGAIPVQLPIFPEMEDADLQAFISRCDGFLLPGGADFEASWYGETLLPDLAPDPGRLPEAEQASALRFIRAAVASGKPILGICLGIQVLTIALGGSLWQDIPTQLSGTVCHRAPANKLEDRWQFAHSVRLVEGSLIHSLSGAAEIEVNSFHHQAIHNLPAGFRATAWAPDGVIEAMESDSGQILAVQWHPENLSHAALPEARALFRWLKETAENK